MLLICIGKSRAHYAAHGEWRGPAKALEYGLFSRHFPDSGAVIGHRLGTNVGTERHAGIEMKRRGFLAGLIAAPVICHAEWLMPIKPERLFLYGDGLHDDTLAINAFMRGERVLSAVKTRLWCGGLCLDGGSFKTSGTVMLGNGRGIINSSISGLGDGPVIDVSESRRGVLMNMVIECNGKAACGIRFAPHGLRDHETRFHM